MIVIREIELPFDTQKQAYTLPDVKYSADDEKDTPYKNRNKQIWDDKGTGLPGAIDSLLASNNLIEAREYPFGKVLNYKYPSPGDRFKFGVVLRSDGVMRYVKIYAASIADVKNLFKRVLYKQRTEHEASVADPKDVLLLLTKAFGVGVTRNGDSAVTKKVVEKFTSEFTKRFQDATGKVITDFGIRTEYVKDTKKKVDARYEKISAGLGDLLSDKLIVTMLYIDTSLQLAEVEEVKAITPVIKKDVDSLYADICRMAFSSCVNYVRDSILEFPKNIEFIYSIYSQAEEIEKTYKTIGAMKEKGVSFINTSVLQGIMKTNLTDLEKRLLSVISNASTGSPSDPGSSSSTESLNSVTPVSSKGYGEGGFSTGAPSSSGSSTNTGSQSEGARTTGGNNSKDTPESIIQKAWTEDKFTKIVTDALFPACEKSMDAAVEALKTFDETVFTKISRDEYASDNSRGDIQPNVENRNLFDAFGIQPAEFPTIARYTKNGDLPLFGSGDYTKQSKSSSLVRHADKNIPTNSMNAFSMGFIKDVLLSFENDFEALRKASIDALEGTYSFHSDFLDSPEAKKIVLTILTKEGLIAEAKESGISPEVSIDENSYKVFEFSNNTDEAILSKPFKVISDALASIRNDKPSIEDSSSKSKKIE